MLKREVDHFIIFEIHPVACCSYANVLVGNLKSLKPEKTLTGDIIDIWQFSNKSIVLVTFIFWYIRFTANGNFI